MYLTKHFKSIKGFSLLEMLVVLIIISIGIYVFNGAKLRIYWLQGVQEKQFETILSQFSQQSIKDIVGGSISNNQLNQLLVSVPNCEVAPSVQCANGQLCSVSQWVINEHWESKCL